jgi:hypothetical protein
VLKVLSGPDPVLQTFVLDKLNLEAVFMSTYAAGMGQFDNLVLDLYSAPSTVPEPSTPMLWLASALCVASRARKKISASRARARSHHLSSVSPPAPEKVDFPAEDHTGGHPIICGRVPDNVRFAVADKDAGVMAKLLEVIVNYLRNRSF